MKKGNISVSWGGYGGFYIHIGFAKRICLGWVAVSFMPLEIDDLIEAYGRDRS